MATRSKEGNTAQSMSKKVCKSQKRKIIQPYRRGTVSRAAIRKAVIEIKKERAAP